MFGWTVRFRFGGIESSLGYLERMAAKGWMLESWQESTLIFRREEVKQLRFAMDIIPIGIWKPDSEEHNEAVKEEYVAMYEEMGWRYVENQGRKFLFCTEDETLPMPQTDPVAYKETIYKAHIKGLIFAGILLAAAVWLMRVLWSEIHLYLLDVYAVTMLLVCACLAMAAFMGVVQTGWQVWRERQLLNRQIIPDIRGMEWLGRVAAAAWAVAMVIAVVLNGKNGSFVTGAGWLCILVGGWAIANGMPAALRRWNYPPRKVSKVVRYSSMVMILAANLLILSSADQMREEEYSPWPAGMQPIVTEGELYGVGEDASFYMQYPYLTYRGCLAEQYTYHSAHEISGCSVTYELYVSGFGPALRSMERNPYVYNPSPYPGDGIDYWAKDIVWLDHEALGMESAWTYCHKTERFTPYKYFFRTKTAALFLMVDQELSEEWIREICARLAEIK